MYFLWRTGPSDSSYVHQVKVYKKPVVAILSTGNELVDLQATSSVSSPDGWSGIFDTNRPSLQAALESMGYEVVDLGIVIDEYGLNNLSLRKKNQANQVSSYSVSLLI